MPIPTMEARLLEQLDAYREAAERAEIRALQAEALNLTLKTAMIAHDQERQGRVVEAQSVER